MTASGFQSAFAYVLVHRDVRERLAEHSRDLQTRFALTDDEIRTLVAVSPSRLQTSASIVATKRFEFLSRALPRASTVLGGHCQCSLMEYAEACPPTEETFDCHLNRSLVEGRRFIGYLERVRPAQAPTYAVDLARYELARMELRYNSAMSVVSSIDHSISDRSKLRLGDHVTLGEFGFDVIALASAAVLPPTAAPQRTLLALAKTQARRIVPYRIGAVVYLMLKTWQTPARVGDVQRAIAAEIGSACESQFGRALDFALREGIVVPALPES